MADLLSTFLSFDFGTSTFEALFMVKEIQRTSGASCPREKVVEIEFEPGFVLLSFLRMFEPLRGLSWHSYLINNVLCNCSESLSLSEPQFLDLYICLLVGYAHSLLFFPLDSYRNLIFLTHGNPLKTQYTFPKYSHFQAKNSFNCFFLPDLSKNWSSW